MTYYLYQTPDGHVDIVDHLLNLDIFPGHVFIQQTDTPPSPHHLFFEDGKFVNRLPDPQYQIDRKLAYPAVGDQLDMLWHAMDDGLIPKIEPMYSDIKAVKEAYPKPSN